MPSSWQLQKLSLTGNPSYSGSKTMPCSGYSLQQQFWGEERTWGGGWGKNKMPFVFKRKTLTSPWISTPLQVTPARSPAPRTAPSPTPRPKPYTGRTRPLLLAPAPQASEERRSPVPSARGRRLHRPPSPPFPPGPETAPRDGTEASGAPRPAAAAEASAGVAPPPPPSPPLLLLLGLAAGA